MCHPNTDHQIEARPINNPYFMRKTILPVGLIIWAVIFPSPESLSQEIADTNSQATKPDAEIKQQLSLFREKAATDFTNSNIGRDQILQPLKKATELLQRNQSKLDRHSKTILWFEILAEIDRFYSPDLLSTNAPVSISGWIAPPPGYKGKVGLSGMEPPDTNDLAMCAYYENAKKTNQAQARMVSLQHELERMNQSFTFEANRFLKRAYTSTETDKKELAETLEKAPLSNERKQKIKSALLQK